jgi:hypothetical protein
MSEPDCVLLILVLLASLRVICQFPESESADTGVLLLPPQALIDSDRANRNAILRSINVTSSILFRVRFAVRIVKDRMLCVKPGSELFWTFREKRSG